MTIVRLAPLLVALAAPLLAGCFGPIAGRHGQLAFEYRAPDDLFGRASVERAIARGSRVELGVFAPKRGLPQTSFITFGDPKPDQGGQLLGRRLPERPSTASLEKIAVDEATSARPDVAEVLGVDQSVVKLYGRAPGRAEITVRAGASTDAITVAVAEVARAKVEHWAALLLLGDRFASDAAFVKGGAGRFLLTAYDASGGALLGFGDAAPLAIEPASAASIAPSPEDLHHVVVRFDAPGDVTLRAKGGQAMRVPVVDASAIRALDLVELGGKEDAPAPAPPSSESAPKPSRSKETIADVAPLASQITGRDFGVMARGTLADGRKVLLLGDAVTVTMTPAEVCAPLPPEEARTVRSLFGDGLYAARITAQGSCAIEARLGGLSARAAITVTPRR